MNTQNNNLEQLKAEHELAYFRGQLALDFPDSYTLEEKHAICREMESSTKAVEAAMREDFQKLSSAEQDALMRLLVQNGSQPRSLWERVLIA